MDDCDSMKCLFTLDFFLKKNCIQVDGYTPTFGYFAFIFLFLSLCMKEPQQEWFP